jgi:hypothetical protein
MSCVPLPWCTSQSMISIRSTPCSACATRAATATLLNRQNPMARSRRVVAGRPRQREARCGPALQLRAGRHRWRSRQQRLRHPTMRADTTVSASRRSSSPRCRGGRRAADCSDVVAPCMDAAAAPSWRAPPRAAARGRAARAYPVDRLHDGREPAHVLRMTPAGVVAAAVTGAVTSAAQRRPRHVPPPSSSERALRVLHHPRHILSSRGAS